MSSVNKAIIIGTVGKDPETKTFSNGNKVSNFSVATSERWKDKNTGEKQEKTQWHNIAIFNERLITVAENYLKKGSKVYIEGQIETRKWTDQNGQERYTTEIVLKAFRGELTLLGGRESSEQPNTAHAQAPHNQQRPPQTETFEDEIPF